MIIYGLFMDRIYKEPQKSQITTKLTDFYNPEKPHKIRVFRNL